MWSRGWQTSTARETDRKRGTRKNTRNGTSRGRRKEREKQKKKERERQPKLLQGRVPLARGLATLCLPYMEKNVGEREGRDGGVRGESRDPVEEGSGRKMGKEAAKHQGQCAIRK